MLTKTVPLFNYYEDKHFFPAHKTSFQTDVFYLTDHFNCWHKIGLAPGNELFIIFVSANNLTQYPNANLQTSPQTLMEL